MAKIIISGYYGFDNLGDEAILMSMIEAFKSIDKNLEITVLSNSPEKTSNEYGVDSINRNNILAFIKELKSADLFISGGGSLLQDVTGWKSIPFYLGQVILAKILRRKTVVFAQGIGPVQNKKYQYIIKKVLGKVDLLSVRDFRSKDLLENWGLNEKEVKLAADPVYFLKTISKNKSSEHRELFSEDLKRILSSEKPLIGVSVRPWGDNNYLSAMADSLAKLARNITANLLITPMHFHEDQETSLKLKKMIIKKFNESKYQGEIMLDLKKYTPGEMLDIYKKLDLLIGVRLHSLIFAAVNNVPFVAVEYDPKVKAFLEMISLTSGIDIENLDSKKLLRISESIWKNREQFKGVLEQQGSQLNKLALNNFITVLDMIEERNNV
ncbi:polysaccharide pyruvyl transferase CsaB [Natronospora cellulosivora (SeqCode)]